MDYFETLNEEEKHTAQIILENSQRELNEAPTLSTDASFADSLVGKLIFYVQEALTASDLVDVQPIGFNQGKVIGLDILDDTGKVIQGPGAVSAFNAAFSEIAENVDVPGIHLLIKEADLVLKSRKAQLNYSKELAQDMKILQFELEKEKIKIVGTELANGIDFDIVEAISELAAVTYTPLEYTWLNDGTVNVSSLLTELRMLMFQASATIAANTRKGLANFVVVPSLMVQLVTSMDEFECEDDEKEPMIGAVSKIGKLGFMDVYANTFDTTTYDMVIGKKPAGNISSGIVYSPYSIITGDEITDPENFSIHQFVMNRYGVTKMETGGFLYHIVRLAATPTGFPFTVIP